ncbi:aminotransferase class V-fold PLP-dependent enzyme [Saccharopolyspora sp. ASAGF58]|uniref:aminotransferase class V-fold PLP-dependent enzyme n=1 Tax=Saccharopolyspora sp. ASAGF58 TaxID=2719023 RepID=UPI001440279C|nr:aminotransferase class V-fold PLP-dependent enzyme [Saccharopolyspora sp. ASAGF58]QIZ34153.1 aminotransferase class V-fold PLP-dependent enzyme [Saccharopolyspora sp. ASAGF58]
MREAFGATFDVPDGYLNTASIGIPPVDAARAVADSVARWGSGLDGPKDFDPAVATARAAFARLIGTTAERVAIGSTASQLVGLVAASLPAGARVLVAANEFTSVVFPFAAQRDRGVRVTEVELSEIAEHAADHDVVAVSVVQSSDGRIADLDGLRQVAAANSTRVLLDVTQALGWLPLQLDWADWVVGAAYKWLLSPRGAAWLAVHPDAPEIRPSSANWYAGQDPWSSTYGLPLRLADGARALDLSPTWLAQVGAAAAMDWLAGIDMTAVAKHCAGLADEFRTALDLPAAGSAIVSVQVPDAVSKLTAAGVACAARAGRARLSFHLYNTGADVERAVLALR